MGTRKKVYLNKIINKYPDSFNKFKKQFIEAYSRADY